jgi:dolichol-phosphate mannosyltransferase
MSEINIIIPTYNEEDNISKLLKTITKKLPNCKITIVDDSKNNNIQFVLKKEKLTKNIMYIHRKNSRGRGSAVLFGFKKRLKKNTKQIFVEMDADFSHNPSELKKNIKLFKNQKSDLLISSRYLPKSKIFHWSLSRRIFSKLSNILARIILNIKVSDYTNGFRIYSKNATKLIVKKCGKIGDGFIVLSEILLILDINKFKINEVSSIFINRVRGESSVNLKLIIQSFMGLIKLFFIKRNYKN